MADIAARSYVRSRLTAGMTAGVALTAASAITLAPLVVPDLSPAGVSAPRVSTPNVDLAAAITPADVTALINGLDDALGSVSPTVSNVARVPGVTLVGALDAAAGLNNSLWDQLINATNNPALIRVLTALRDVSNGGLSELAATAGATNDTVTLTTGQVASVLMSTLTGSAAVAQHAVATAISNPVGLINVPIDIAGLGLNSGLAAARALGVNGLDLGNTMVHGVTSQISSIVSAVNDLASRGVTGAPLIDGFLSAVQAVALMPVTVGIAGINGLSDTLTEAGSTAWTRITNGAAASVTTWIGNGTDAGAVQNAITRIGSEPLSPAAYTDASSTLVGAVITTGQIAIGTASSIVSIPVRAAARLTTTGADMIKSFNSQMATAAAGLMHAAGLPSFVSNLPHVLASAVNGAITVAAFAASTTLSSVATAIDIGNTLTGAMPAQRVLTLNVATDSTSLTADSASMETTSDAESEASTEFDTHASTETPTTATTTGTNNDFGDETETTGATAESVTPVNETEGDRAAAEATEVTESADPTTGAVEPECPPTDAPATATDDTATTKHTTSDGSKKTSDEPAPAVPANRPKSESETDEDSKKDEAKKPDADNSSNRTTTGGRHSRDTIKNGATVNEIKARLDKETSAAASNAGVAA